VLCLLSNEGVVTTTIREGLTSCESNNGQVSYSLSPKSEDQEKLFAGLQGLKT
jgi:hypothetical protein